MTIEEYRALHPRKPPAAASMSPAEYREQHVKPKAKKPPKMPKATANQITKAAILWLNLNGFKAWRVNNGAIFDPKTQRFRKSKHHTPGIPDIGGFEKGTGRALYIEVKAGADTLKPAQIQFLQEAEAGGAITGVIRSSLEVEEIIKKYRTAA